VKIIEHARRALSEVGVHITVEEFAFGRSTLRMVRLQGLRRMMGKNLNSEAVCEDTL
jgi:hypothetical protein